LVLAVSDGHGSPKCFRSDVGARLAVQTATKVILELLENLSEPPNLSIIKRWTEENLPREIVRRWQDAIADDILDRPFTVAELKQLKSETNARKGRQVALNPSLAYGATLLTVLVAESFIIYLQLGDGDILTVSETGEVSRPLPPDDRLFANETTSLSSKDAWREFRHHFRVISGPPPALILVSSDGYANSFRDEASFLSVGADFLNMIRSDGLDAVRENLEMWLTEVSQKGSGDDIALGIICRMEALKLPVGRVLGGYDLDSKNSEAVEPRDSTKSSSDQDADTLKDAAVEEKHLE